MTRRLNRRQLRKMIFETILRENTGGIEDTEKVMDALASISYACTQARLQQGPLGKFVLDTPEGDEYVKSNAVLAAVRKLPGFKVIAQAVKGKSGTPLNPLYTFVMTGKSYDKMKAQFGQSDPDLFLHLDENMFDKSVSTIDSLQSYAMSQLDS